MSPRGPEGAALAAFVLAALVATPDPAHARMGRGPYAVAFVDGPWPDVRTDAALAQQLAREAIKRSRRLAPRDLAGVLDPKGDPEAVAALREANELFRKGFVAFSNEEWEEAHAAFTQSVRRRMDGAALMESPDALVQAMQYAGAAAVRQGEYRQGVRWFHRASVLAPEAELNARGAGEAMADLYERVRRRATGLPPSEIRVLSEPDGASVHLDGTFVGVTPAVIPAPLPGTHMLRVEKDGYLNVGRDIEILPGPTEEIPVELRPTRRLEEFQATLAAAMPLLDKDNAAKPALAKLAKMLGVDSVILGRVEPRGEAEVALFACEFGAKGKVVGRRASRSFGYRSAAFRKEVEEFFDELLLGQGKIDPRVAMLPPPPPIGESAAPAPLDLEDEGPPIYASWWFWTGVGVLAAGGGAAATAAALPGASPKPEARGELIFQF